MSKTTKHQDKFDYLHDNKEISPFKIMTTQEYKEWKENNQQEFEQLSKECLERWVYDSIKHELDDVAYQSPIVDKNLQIVTYRKILEALIRKDNFCGGLYDELIRMHKQYMDYKKFHKK